MLAPSILPRPARPRATPLRLGILFVALLVVAVFAGSALAVVTVRFAESAGGGLGGAILRKGPETVARRTILIAIVLLLPILIRAAGWHGVADLGWGEVPWRRGRWRPVLRTVAWGWVLGVVTLGALIAAQYLGGARRLDRVSALAALPWMAITGLGIAAMEETLARGILFLPLARIWKGVPTAVLISGLFAWAHILEPTADAFGAPGLLRPTLRVAATTFASAPDDPSQVMRMAGLFLMSLVLCLTVVRTRTIWLAVGLHAGWVLVKSLSGRAGNRAHPAPDLAWLLGGRSDALDGVVSLAMLLVLGLWVFRMRPVAPSSPTEASPPPGPLSG